MTALEVEVQALAQLAPQLAVLGAFVKMGSATAVPEANAAVDSPSFTAIRGVSSETIPGLRTTVADRFTAVGENAQRVATEFAKASSSMARTEAGVTAVMTGSGSLLPPSA
ncbi:MAG: hypothetical protein U0R77_05210 [Mycolicibacterium insubricum]